MSKTLVTGGAGFIGTHLVDALIASGNEVCVLDDFSASDRLVCDKLRGRATVFDGSVTDAKLLQAILSDGIEHVFHLAARNMTVSAKDPEKAFAVNAGGTMILLREAAKSKVRHVVYTSTTSVYDDTGTMPMTESTRIRPLTAYSVAKYAGELCRLSVPECRLTMLRLSNVYGPGQTDSANPSCGVIGHFMRAARDEKPIVIFGDGTATRDYTFIGDVVKALMVTMAAVDSKRSNDAAYAALNVSTGVETSTLDLAKAVQKISGKQLTIEHRNERSIDTVKRRVVDSSAFRKEFGLESFTSLNDGLNQTWKWWQECSV